MYGSRIRRRGLLRPWVLSMLEKGPKNGAEIINEIGRASFGWWRPSPGSVYPMLEDMCQEGLIQKNNDGRYEITERGKEETYWSFGPLSNKPRGIDDILNEIESYLSYFEDLAKTDHSKMETYANQIRIIADRFSKLANS